MRKIKDLLEKNEKVWFYIEENDELKAHFSKELSDEGFSFSNGSPLTRDIVGPFMAVHTNGKITYVSLMAWTASFGAGNGLCGINHSFAKIPKVDFSKYINSDDDYLIES